MATDKLINQTQGDDIIDALSDIADNVGNITYGPQTSADKVVSMLGYAEAAEAASINPGDTLNQAIGKLEKKADDNATAVAGKIDKLTNATAGDIATVTSSGEIADSAVAIAKSGTGLLDSDAAVPTSKTVKTYVDSTATGISRYIGTITAASQLSTSAKKGDFYIVKTAWSGVHVGDEIIAETDSPAQTIDGTNWSLLHNEADTDTKYTFATGTTNGTFKVTPSDTGTAQSVPIKGLGNAAYKGVADTVSTSTDLVTSAAVNTKLASYVPNSDLAELQDDVTGLNSSLVDVVDNGAKNLFNITAASGTYVGITCTSAYDSFTLVSGTANASPSLLLLGTVVLSAGTYTLTGCPSTGSDTTYRLDIRNGSTVLGGTYGEPVEITVPSETTVGVYIRLQNGYAIPSGGLTFKPMLCTKSQFDISPTYEPYALGNQVLTPALIEQVDSGAKNLWDFANAVFDTSSYATYTKTDTAIVVQANGRWGMASYKLTLSAGTYIFRCIISNLTTAAATQTRIRISDGNQAITSTWAVTEQIATNGVLYKQFTTTGGTVYIQYYASYGDVSSTTNTFTASENMFCTLADWNVSHKYVPYRPNWDLVAEASMSALTLKRGTNIPTNSSMDTYTKIGKYYCADGTTAGTLTNAPWSNVGYSMTVSETYQNISGVPGILQEAYAVVAGALQKKSRIYYYASSTWAWTAWA